MKVSTSGRNPKAIVMNVRERSRGWLNPVNLHWAGVAVLGLVCVYLVVEMGLAWQQANSQNAEAVAQQQLQLRAAQIAARPLEGLDVKLAAASGTSNDFYNDRLPVSYSQILSELGSLKDRSKVRLTRVNYSQPALGTGGSASTIAFTTTPEHLTEVLVDASLTGDYRGLVTFVNSMERDRVFFLIDGITLTGQQTGQVSLRIRATTYLRDVAKGDLERANADASTPMTEEGAR